MKNLQDKYYEEVKNNPPKIRPAVINVNLIESIFKKAQKGVISNYKFLIEYDLFFAGHTDAELAFKAHIHVALKELNKQYSKIPIEIEPNKIEG